MYFIAPNGQAIFTLSIAEDSNQAIDWPSQKDIMKPPDLVFNMIIFLNCLIDVDDQTSQSPGRLISLQLKENLTLAIEKYN